MSVPMNFEKEFNDWTFEDLVKWACWEVVQSMYQGSELRTTMFRIVQTVRQWDPKKEIK